MSATTEKRATELFRRELELDQQLEAKQSTLAEVESLAGESLVDGDDLDEPTRRVVAARGELEVLRQGVQACRAERAKVIRDGFRREASDLRKQAGRLRKEADGRQARLDEMLADLRDFEGVEYVVKPRLPATQLEAVRVLDSGFTPAGVGKTEQLRTEADELEGQAAEVEAQEVPTISYLVGASLDDLLAEVEAAGPMVVGPTGEEIRRVFSETKAQPAPSPTVAPNFRVGGPPVEPQAQPEMAVVYILRRGADGTLSGSKELRAAEATAAA